MAAIAATLVVAYAGTMGVPLLLDDVRSITDNPSIRSLWDLRRVFTPPAEALTAGRPVTNFTFAICYALSGVEPWSYHLVNLAIHVLASLTLFGVVRRTLLTPKLEPRWGKSAVWLAGSIALLWGVHPLQTETVTYVSQRAESLMALFYLLTLYGFIRGVEGRKGLWHSLAVVACLLGALSKEVIVTAPLMVWLYDRTFVAGSFRAALRERKIFYSALASTWIVIGWLLLDVNRRGVGFGIGVSSFHYALTQCRAVTLYLGLSLWPHPLIFDRGTPVITAVGEALPYALVLAGLVATSVWTWVRNPALGFAPAWFFVLLAPASSIVPVNGSTIAENRVYLPLAAVVVLVVLAAHRCFSSRVAGTICAILALVATVATVSRNRDFQSGVRIWADTVAKAPNNPRAHYNLALLLAAEPNQQRDAMSQYAEALRLKPDYAMAHNNFAALVATIPNREQEALKHFVEALRLNPEFAEAHCNLASLLAAMPGRQQEALDHFKEALRIKPDYAEAHNHMALVFAAMPNRQQEALDHCMEALRLKPNYAEAHNNVALLLAAMPNRQQEALDHYVAAIRLLPGDPAPHYNLALLLATMPNRQPDALAHYAEALRLKPDYAEAHNNIALLLAMMPNRQSEALAHYAEALRLNPNFAEAHNNFAMLLAAQPNRQQEALEHYEAAARLLPDNAVIHFNLARLLENFAERKAEAELHYLKAISLAPNFTAARESLERLRTSGR